MKFGKVLETNSEAMPEEWRPYVIRYKSLKKKINAIVRELDERGLPSPIIKNLLSQTMSGDVQRLEYSFDGDKEHLKPCIKVVIGDLEPGSEEAKVFGPAPLLQDEHLSKFFAHELAFLNNSASSSTSDLQEQLQAEMEGKELDGPSNSLEDLVDDTTSDMSSENASVAGEDLTDRREIVNGIDMKHETASSVIAAATVSEAATTDANQIMDKNDHQLSSGHTTSTTFTNTHGPTSCTSSTASASSRARTPSPLSNPSVQPDSLQRDGPGAEAMSPPSRRHSPISPPSSPSDIMETIITPGAMHERQSVGKNARESPSLHPLSGNSQILTTEEDGKRVLVIELSTDTEFFDQLGDEVSQLSKLQEINKQEFESKVEDLSKILTVVASPQNKDMYTWREILKIYLDAQVFVGDQESDRLTRSSEKAQKQLQWFLKEMERSKLIHKFKLPKSKAAFNTFFSLNSELIMMKQFKELNQMAMTKILKKHDKRTNLTASAGFPKHLQKEPFYNDNISKSLTYTIGNQLVSIIPQPDDYACPICMSVAWKPIRLRCQHVFCVRCLIKAQRKKMMHCPICRQTNSVVDADASNLDVSMMNFLKLYFPKEIKEKRKESSREQAVEEMEAITGHRWTETSEPACIIM
ncbi:hypothetical protein BGZ51_004847 [Haplosporangium sp. Z 767]|nr:hypothetical protein BGZ51_004847 [Haplosporangium sp. Z 767]